VDEARVASGATREDRRDLMGCEKGGDLSARCRERVASVPTARLSGKAAKGLWRGKSRGCGKNDDNGWRRGCGKVPKKSLRAGKERVIHRGVHNCGISRYAAFSLRGWLCAQAPCCTRAAVAGRHRSYAGILPSLW
jgi:hypothetical protein